MIYISINTNSVIVLVSNDNKDYNISLHCNIQILYKIKVRRILK